MERLELYTQLLFISSQSTQIYQVMIILQPSVFPFHKMKQRPTSKKLHKVGFKEEQRAERINTELSQNKCKEKSTPPLKKKKNQLDKIFENIKYIISVTLYFTLNVSSSTKLRDSSGSHSLTIKVRNKENTAFQVQKE